MTEQDNWTQALAASERRQYHDLNVNPRGERQ